MCVLIPAMPLHHGAVSSAKQEGDGAGGWLGFPQNYVFPPWQGQLWKKTSSHNGSTTGWKSTCLLSLN